jgi:hypothetical protein
MALGINSRLVVHAVAAAPGHGLSAQTAVRRFGKVADSLMKAVILWDFRAVCLNLPKVLSEN